MFKCNSWDNLQYQLYIILGRNSATHPKQGPEQKSWKPKVASNVTSIHIIHSISDFSQGTKESRLRCRVGNITCVDLYADPCWLTIDQLMIVQTWFYSNLATSTLVPTVELSPGLGIGIGKYLGNALLLAASPQTVADPELTGVEEESSEEVMPSCKCDVVCRVEVMWIETLVLLLLIINGDMMIIAKETTKPMFSVFGDVMLLKFTSKDGRSER